MNDQIKSILNGDSPRSIIEDKKTPLTEAAFKDFSTSDWDAFAGAEEYEDGTPPRITEIQVTFVIVADKDGVEITDGSIGWRVRARGKSNQDSILQKLKSEFNLEDLGFKAL